MGARAIRLAGLVVATCLLLGAVEAGRPVYVQLVVSFEDYVNLEFSEPHLARTLSLLRALQHQHPAAHVVGTLEVNGATASALVDRRASGLLDKVREAQREGVIEIGYDGSEEPTRLARPRPELRRASSAADRWTARGSALAAFLTEARDGRTGEPLPSGTGGLKRVKEVLGAPVAVWGAQTELGGDAELVHQLERMGVSAILPGVAAADTEFARNLHGYRGSAAWLARLVSPGVDTAPELFWLDHALHLSDLTVEGTRMLPAHEGPTAFEALTSKLDGTRPHVVRVHLGDHALYFKAGLGRRRYVSPLEYAHDNPKDARLPEEAVRPVDEVQAGYAREEALLRWLVEEFLPRRPGSRIVGASDLRAMTAGDTQVELSRQELLEAASTLRAQWREVAPETPPYVTAGGRYVSLAEMFALLARALDARHRTGALPDTVVAARLYGPLEVADDGALRPRAVSAEAAAAVASALWPTLVETGWQPVPAHVVPSKVEVGGAVVSASQFLRLMTEAVLEPGDTLLDVRPTATITPLGLAWPRNRPLADAGNTWTLKPALLRAPSGS